MLQKELSRKRKTRLSSVGLPNYLAYPQCSVYTEVGNITYKCNGVTRCRLGHVLRAIIFRSDNGSNVDRAITLRGALTAPMCQER